MTEQIDYDPNTVLEALNNKADRDLNNVTDGTYQVLTTKNITNCITKIPQDIKLELADKKLYLSIGSKVYDGNGLLKTITEQTNQNYNITAGTRIFLYEIERNTIVSFSANRLASGDSLPADNTNCDIFYLTSDKKVYRYLNSVWSANTGYSFPICIATTDGVGVTSIDQVFNGFGYIGSTIFALPGVEGLIPNGRNADGSLNNTKFTTTSVLTANALFNANLASIVVNSTFLTMVTDNNVRYDNNNNFNFLVNNNDKYFAAFVGTVSIKDLKITSFIPKNPFQAVDRNEINNIIDTRINYRFQVVSELPPVQDSNTFYFIPEE